MRWWMGNLAIVQVYKILHKYYYSFIYIILNLGPLFYFSCIWYTHHPHKQWYCWFLMGKFIVFSNICHKTHTFYQNLQKQLHKIFHFNIQWVAHFTIILPPMYNFHRALCQTHWVSCFFANNFDIFLDFEFVLGTCHF